MVIDDRREAAQQPGPVTGRQVAPGRKGAMSSLDRRVGLLEEVIATSVICSSVAGLITLKLCMVTSSRSCAATPSR
ncbi:hypothetical protein [Microlunatus endophyticus]